MAEWTIDCSLPYRVRVSDRTYTVSAGSGVDVQIELRAVQREEFDPRIGGGRNIELVVDRHGWGAYSEVAARVDAPDSRVALTHFLSALNNLIAQARDLFEIPWMHEVDQDDLFNLTVGTPGGSFQTALGYPRTRGIRTAMVGLTESGEKRLAGRLARYEPVAPWRVLDLDAADALDRGRYEEAVVLAWSALESGCRTTLPRLAEQHGLDPSETYSRLTRRARQPPPWSYEEAVNRPPRPPNVMSIVRLTAELSRGAFSADALAASAGRGYELRNRIVHNGARLSPDSAREAVDSIRWCLHELGLPKTVPVEAPNVNDWVEHFGEMSLPLDDLLGPHLGRLIVVHADQNGVGVPISVEGGNRDVIVGLPSDGVSERDAAILCVAMHGALFPTTSGLPRFFVPSADTLLVHGLVAEQARALNSMLRAFVTLRDLAERYTVQASMRRALEFYESPTPDITFSFNDVRMMTLPAHIAPYGAMAGEEDWERCVRGLREWHEPLAERAERWAEFLRTSSGKDPHSLCEVAKRVHAELMPFDSIHIDCPIEQRVYGFGAVDYAEYRSQSP